MNCFVFLFTPDSLIYSSLGLSSPCLERSRSLTINLHPVCFLSAVADDLPFNCMPPCRGDMSSIRVSFSAAVRKEGPGRVTPSGDDGTVDGVYLCVFLLILASRKQGAVTSACCHAPLSPHKWTDYLWWEGGEFSGGEPSMHMRGQRGGLQQYNTGTHEYHSGQHPCARWRRHVSCPCIPPYAEHIKKRPQTVQTWSVCGRPQQTSSALMHPRLLISKQRRNFNFPLFAHSDRFPAIVNIS